MNKEQLILEAAELEFFTKGYDGARTASIAEKAGVTHAMLHYYFRTKEQLFERIVSKNVTLLVQTVLEAMGKPEMPLIERLRDGIASHFDLVSANPLLPRFFLNEIVLHPERYRIVYENIEEAVVRICTGMQSEIDSAAARNEIEWVDIRKLFMSIISLNIFPHIVCSFAEPLTGYGAADREKFLSERKAENIETIMRRIQKR